MSKLRLIFGAITLGVLAVAGYVYIQSIRPHILEIYFMDVPGTPAVFIRTPNDKRILVNGGSNSEIIKHLNDILPFYSKHLDMIIVAEPNGKAASGLIDVLNRYTVDRVGLIAATSSDAVYGVFLKTLGDLKIVSEELQAGQQLNLNDEVTADVLFPAPASDFKYSNASGPEIVLRIKYGATSLLLIGEISLKIQKFLASSALEADDVLITSVNPTDSNLTRQLLASTSPTYLIYRATKEPARDKTKNLAGIVLENRFNIHETGAVKIVSDGKTLKINKI